MKISVQVKDVSYMQASERDPSNLRLCGGMPRNLHLRNTTNSVMKVD